MSRKKEMHLDCVVVCFLGTLQCPGITRLSRNGWVVQVVDFKLQIFSEASL